MHFLKTGQTFKRKKFNTSGLIDVLAATKAQMSSGGVIQQSSQSLPKHFAHTWPGPSAVGSWGRQATQNWDQQHKQRNQGRFQREAFTSRSQDLPA